MFLSESRPFPLRRLVPAVAVLAVAVACGNSNGTSGGASGGAKAGGSSHASKSARAIADIRLDWVSFFNGKTPADRKIQLLQNGQKFATIVKAQASSPLAASSSATVQSVTVSSATTAKVIYTILLGGKAALSKQNGLAVLQSGTWKVGDVSFCALLALENGGKPPTACSGPSS